MSRNIKIVAFLISTGAIFSLIACRSDHQQTGKSGVLAPVDRAVTAASPQAIELGRQLYGYSCAACHQLQGQGMEGVGPPLIGSPWVSGSPQRLVRIVMHGVRGPIEVQDANYNLEMPAMGFFRDQEIAAILTYLRQSFGHHSPPIDSATVAGIRQATADRGDSWTVEELMAISEH